MASVWLSGKATTGLSRLQRGEKNVTSLGNSAEFNQTDMIIFPENSFGFPAWESSGHLGWASSVRGAPNDLQGEVHDLPKSHAPFCGV
jgi:hypothetical protein